jgi:AcrR family transcriptional regulator
MAESQAREKLLDAAVRHALEAGIADLSLRELAAAIGTSHRMLIYHFGSREGLLVAVAKAVEESQRALVFGAGSGGSVEDGRAFWKRITNPKMWPQERLFFELYVHALLGRPGTERFLDDIVESWVAPIAAAEIDRGVDERTARADARLSLGVVRGLILDLLATGDRKGVTEAFDRYLALTPIGTRPAPRARGRRI